MTEYIVRIDEIKIDTGHYRTRFVTVDAWRQYLIDSGDWALDSPAAQMYHDYDYAMTSRKWLDVSEIKLWYINMCEGYLTRVMPWPDQQSTEWCAAENLIHDLIEDAREWLARTDGKRQQMKGWCTQ